MPVLSNTCRARLRNSLKISSLTNTKSSHLLATLLHRLQISNSVARFPVVAFVQKRDLAIPRNHSGPQRMNDLPALLLVRKPEIIGNLLHLLGSTGRKRPVLQFRVNLARIGLGILS